MHVLVCRDSDDEVVSAIIRSRLQKDAMKLMRTAANFGSNGMDFFQAEIEFAFKHRGNVSSYYG